MAYDCIKPWFLSAEASGEYIGIRYGRIAPGATEPEWTFFPHTQVDGIGAFAEMFRKRGVDVGRLPQIKHPSMPSRLSSLRVVPKFLTPKRPLKWADIKGNPGKSSNTEPPTAVAWYCFDETTTTAIRRVCRKASITVNSFLVKHLTKAIRPFLADHSAPIPWMLPVNLRGKVIRVPDTQNHSTYITVNIQSFDTVHDVHRRIYEALARGDHWANWYCYDSSRLMPGGLLNYLVRTDRYIPVWHIGSFSNLGDWDAEKKITEPSVLGDWLFCPPVLRCQHLGTGCVTFQNRLGLLIQAHPELTTSPESPKAWIRQWVKEIEIDLASMLAEPETFVPLCRSK